MTEALPTLREVWRLALPSGTQLVAGHPVQGQRVLWARRMGMHPPLFGALEAGELAILSLSEAQSVDERLSLPQIVSALAELRAIGACVVGSISKGATDTAEKKGIPLFALPSECDLRDVERAVIRLIVEREAQLDRRGRQIYRQLAQLSLAQRGLEAITETLCELSGKRVFLQDANGLIVGHAWPTGEEETSSGFGPDEIREAIEGDLDLLTWPARHTLDDRAPPTTDRPLANTTQERCVAAIVVHQQLGGYLSIVGPTERLDDLDRLAVERGALVCAVELAKQRAVTIAEDRLRGEFLDVLLTMPLPDRSWLGRRSKELGYPLDGPQRVLLLGLPSPADPDDVIRSLRLAVHHSDRPALVGMHPEEVIVLGSGETHGRQLAERVCREMDGLLVGLGSKGVGIEGARASYRQAQEALALVRQVPAWGPLLSFSDLGALRLLCMLRDSPELENFCREQLGALLAYDKEHGTELLSTLRAFFSHNGNMSRTAEALHLHRNSLIYRLERVADIAGLDLGQAENRFALQLALRLLPLLNDPMVCAL